MSVPGDKSISHRYALLAAIAHGRSRIDHLAPGADAMSTLDCLRALGVPVERQPGPRGATVLVSGRGLSAWTAPRGPLDAGNSGTTTRLIAGLLAACPFTTTIVGDRSLASRPMRRVIDPLTRMGATIGSEDGRLPLTITGGRLHGIDFTPPVPSAQVKSAVLLAGLHADGETIVREPAPTRDHTERALRAFGATVACESGTVRTRGGQRLEAQDLVVPGDASSAAFWAVAAAALPASDVTIEDVGLNPTRTAFIDVVRRAGAVVDVEVVGEHAGEPFGHLHVKSGVRRPVSIPAADVPGLIDELPALAALGALGGDVTVTGASELRVKESDRISALAAGLRALGAEVDEYADGFHVIGRLPLAGGTADAAGDHRLAMTFAIAALGASRPSTIIDATAVDVSYPGFFGVLAMLTT